MVACFSRSCFYSGEKGHIVASQGAQPVKERDSIFQWLTADKSTPKAVRVMQEQGHGKSVPEYARQ